VSGCCGSIGLVQESPSLTVGRGRFRRSAMTALADLPSLGGFSGLSARFRKRTVVSRKHECLPWGFRVDALHRGKITLPRGELFTFRRRSRKQRWRLLRIGVFLGPQENIWEKPFGRLRPI
jgi:hypothetical protein